MPIVHGFGHGVIHQGPPLLVSFPPTLYNPALWLDASDQSTLYQERTGASATTLVSSDADPVGTWRDKSGNARHVTAPSDAARPTFKTGVQNGKSAVRSDGIDDRMSGSFTNLSEYSLFAVYKPIALNSTFNTLISLKANTGMIGIRETSKWYDYSGISTALQESTGTASVGSFYILSSTQKSEEQKLYVNGTLKVSDTVYGTLTSTAYQLFFNSVGTYYNLDACEIIVYPSALSTFQRQLIERYLGSKWGISVA